MSPVDTYSSVQSIYNIKQSLAKEILPIYYFFGDDIFTIDRAVNEVKKSCEKFIESDFDIETISCDKYQAIEPILDLASTFPFGGGKKLIIVRNFEIIKDKKELAAYASDPVETTILIIAHYGKIKSFKSEPLKTLFQKNFLFEAKDLRGAEWVRWLKSEAEREGILLQNSSAQLLVDMVGESKHLLEMHLQKIKEYVGENITVTEKDIKEIASKTREYTIFQLLDSIGAGNKKKSIEIAFNLIEQGFQPLNIISMLTKYVSTIAHSIELDDSKMTDAEASKKIGVGLFFYQNCKKGIFFNNHFKLANAAKVLLEADLAVKTSTQDTKNLLTIIISEMLSDGK